MATALACRVYARFEGASHLLGWVAVVPWLAVLDRPGSFREALGAGVVGAIAFELGVFGWFGHPIDAYASAPPGTGLAVLAAFAPLLQPQCVATAIAWWAARRRGLGLARTAVVVAGAYVGAEWLVPKLFGDTLGYGLWPSAWLRQAADLAGAPGLTLVLVCGNVAVLGALRALLAAGPWRARLASAVPPAATVLALSGGLAAYGAWRTASLAGDGAPPLVRAGVVQASVRRYEALKADLGSYAAVRLILDQHLALSDEALARGPLDLLVWPETVYPTTFGSPKSADGAAFDREIAGFVARAGVPLVFGSYDTEGDAEFNAAVFLEPPVAGRRLEFAAYRKATLFPLTERVPAWLDSPGLRAWMPWLGTWTPGRVPEAVPVLLPRGRTVRVAPLICYDVLDPANAIAAALDGADLIVTLSNDSWFDDGPGPRLHLIGAAFRSIETRRPQLRATNTGISAVIDAGGTLRAVTGVDERAAVVMGVAAGPGGVTPVMRIGSLVAPVAAILGLVGLLLPVAAGTHRSKADAMRERPREVESRSSRREPDHGNATVTMGRRRRLSGREDA